MSRILRVLVLLASVFVAVPASAQIGNFDWLLLSVDARTIATNGGGTAATLTLSPASAVVTITCNDPDTCAITMAEPTLVSGKSRSVVVVNIGSNAITFADTAGVTELASAVSLAQWETLSLEYLVASSRWVERARSTGSGTGAPTTAQYITGATDATLSAERVVTDTSTVAWDLGTAGQAKANVPDGSITLAKQANLATDRLIGRDTAGTGVPEALTVGGGVEFTGSGGIQRSALTGDVTATAGSNATTIANDAVTFAKMQNSSTTSILVGRGGAAGAGDFQEVTLGAGLSMAGTTLSSTVVGTGGGDVVGPGSATNNGFVKFDGTTGKLVKDGAATIAIGSEVSGLGTGVATALGVNVGSAGAPVLFNGALGTPTSGTATNITGLPISTGVSGLGTGIATVLGTNIGADGGLGMVRLAQIVTSSSQATVDFTSISGAYTSLKVLAITRDTAAGTGDSQVNLKVNNDGTSGNYTVTSRVGSANAVLFVTTVAASAAGAEVAFQPNDGNTAGLAASLELTITGYASTTWQKTIIGKSALFTGALNGIVEEKMAVWKSTAAITRLTFSGGTAFKDGAIWTLYGIP